MTDRIALHRIGINIGSSYANIVLMLLVTVLVVPIQVAVLGPIQWGVIALCMTVQGVLFSLDAALSPLLLRDVARSQLLGRAHSIYRGFLRLHIGIAVSVFVLAQAIIVIWQMRTDSANAAAIAWPLRIVLVQFLFQFINNAAIGYWNGQQRQRYANLRLAMFMLIKQALALLLVTQWQPTAIAYALPFAVIAVIECLLNARRVRIDEAKRLTTTHELNDDVGATMNASRESIDGRGLTVFAAAALLGVLSGQIDRIVLSLNLPAAQFGIYFLIGSLMLSLLHLQMPIQRAFLPQLATAENPTPVLAAMLKVSLLLVALPSSVIALFPQPLLRLWLHDDTIATVGAQPLRILMISVVLMVLYAPISLLLLTQHRHRLQAGINAVVLLAQAVFLTCLMPTLGMTAGAWAWLGGSLLQLVCGVLIWRSLVGHECAP